MRRLILSKVTADWRAGSKKFGSPVRREGQSPTLSLPLSMQRGPVPEGRPKSLSVPQICRRNWAHAASETLGTPGEKFGSDDVRPDFGCNECFLATARRSH